MRFFRWLFKEKPEPENPFILPFPLGARFNYLGVRLVVTGHWIQYPCGPRMPMLRADYVNAHGDIKPAEFRGCELPTLMAENMRPD
jgi:hypothetical protein